MEQGIAVVNVGELLKCCIFLNSLWVFSQVDDALPEDYVESRDGEVHHVGEVDA